MYQPKDALINVVLNKAEPSRGKYLNQARDGSNCIKL